MKEGEPVDFRCRASGIPAPTLRWTRVDGASLNPFHTFRDGVFHIPRATKSDDGNYICTGRNPNGEDSQSATLIVRGNCVKEKWSERLEKALLKIFFIVYRKQRAS